MILTAGILDQFDWLEHGFGTRDGITDQNAMAHLKQIHSATVLPAGQSGYAGEGDGLTTNTPDLALSVRTADCFPILLVDARRRAIAAVHAGWRGTAEHIVTRAIETMGRTFESDPGDIYAAIGPGIGECCYEVGEDVARRFGYARAVKLDLNLVNRNQLMASGVPSPHINSLERCTFCDSATFHSYRRDKGDAGRMTSFIRIRSGSQ